LWLCWLFYKIKNKFS
jgi:hypothetical protein